jgi:hypothetical protein
MPCVDCSALLSNKDLNYSNLSANRKRNKRQERKRNKRQERKKNRKQTQSQTHKHTQTQQQQAQTDCGKKTF